VKEAGKEQVTPEQLFAAGSIKQTCNSNTSFCGTGKLNLDEDVNNKARFLEEVPENNTRNNRDYAQAFY